jgi:endonuclease/exonuclease/phosphatase family metal-dependent hydrolase
MIIRALAGSLVVLAALPAAAAAAPRDLTVMTRNTYLGADIIKLVTAQNREQLAQNASQMVATVRANDYPTRSIALAREIARARPDVIGLQETMLLRRSPDGVQQDGAKNATIVEQDQLQILLGRLRARGLRYRAAAITNEIDAEAPVAEGYEMRVTLRDVVLVRSRVRVRRRLGGNFRRAFNVNLVNGPITVRRGWAGIDGRVGGRSFRFVTVHAEAYSAEIAAEQTAQLVRGPLASRRRSTIVVGDFNSDPSRVSQDERGTGEGDERRPAAYRQMTEAGFRNVLRRRRNTAGGPGEDLRQVGGPFSEWIDHILVRPRMRVLDTDVVGERTADRFRGLWPSDHAGVVATIRLR